MFYEGRRADRWTLRVLALQAKILCQNALG